jgi:hypothetical protein
VGFFTLILIYMNMKAILILFLAFFSNLNFAQSLNGAKEKIINSESQQKTIKLCSDSYLTSSTILKNSGEFVSASGGTYFTNDYDYGENLEIHSESAAITGSFFDYNYDIKGDFLNLKNKKHYEFIHFFSKDQKMFGDTSCFEKEIKDNLWTHHSKSSKGDYI